MNDSQRLQSDHWADQVVEEILKWQKENNIEKLHVDDMKTPSGRVHVGSLRGVVLHDVIAKVLAEKTDQEVTSTYVFNDMDSMDKIPAYLPADKYTRWVGKPLYKIPKPELAESGIDFSNRSDADKKHYESSSSYAEFYAKDFIEAFQYLGCSQEVVWSHELYESGQMNALIRHALDNIETIRDIYKSIADYDLPEKWYPFRAFDLSEKARTTLTTDWNSEEITFTSFDADSNEISNESVSPFDGAGKLLWKVDWPAHWKALGVTIEGAGKDHTSAGGSRDMANEQCKKLFNIPVPFDIPYEWILIRGAKMSSSKGVGTAAREFVQLFPPEVGRFLFVNKHYNQVIDFDPRTMAIPDLFDEYDQGARIYWKQEIGDTRLARAFELSQIDSVPTQHFLPRFRDVVVWMQHPEINLVEQFEEIKGSPLSEQELQVLEQRKKHAYVWLNSFAPEEFQLTAKNEMPETAQDLSDEQVQYLVQINQEIENNSWEDPQELQQKMFDIAKASLGARAGFQAVYSAFLGKKSGPRAAWFLLSLDPKLRNTRIKNLSEGNVKDAYKPRFKTLENSELLSFDPGFAKTYPSAIVGVAVIKNVTINKTDPELEIEKATTLSEYQELSTKELSTYPEVLSYRKMYKEMGIDWHSRRPSPEALLRRITQGKDLYTVNTCVDAYNLAVIKNRVSVGAFDLDNISQPVVLKIAQGGEKILLLGNDEETALKAGEVSYFDKKGPYNLDYNYRDAQRTAVQNATKNILINIDGIYDISRQQVEQTLQDTIDLITEYCGGTVELAGILEAKQ